MLCRSRLHIAVSRTVTIVDLIVEFYGVALEALTQHYLTRNAASAVAPDSPAASQMTGVYEPSTTSSGPAPTGVMERATVMQRDMSSLIALMGCVQFGGRHDTVMTVQFP